MATDCLNMVCSVGSSILRFLFSGFSFLRSLLSLFLIIRGGSSRSLSFLGLSLGFLSRSRFFLILSVFLATATLLVDRFGITLSYIVVSVFIRLEERQLAKGSNRRKSRAAEELGNASTPAIALPPLLDQYDLSHRYIPGEIILIFRPETKVQDKGHACVRQTKATEHGMTKGGDEQKTWILDGFSLPLEPMRRKSTCT
jgi:hypothetical protein